MKGVPALYQGRLVSKENFRTFIYAADCSQKLVESWDEYEQHMETGVWFATRKDAANCVAKPKQPKRIRKSAVAEKEEDVELLEEYKDDDFLPKVSE